MRRAARALAAVLVLAACPAAAADDAAAFFAGKQINLYIGSTPGGGYDSYARLLARHFGGHIPGHPTIVPINMPGAGSNKLAYYIYAVAPKDGTALGAIFPGAVIDPLIGDKPVQHDPRRFTYLGSANEETILCIARADSGLASFADAFVKETRFAASAEGGSTRDFPALLDNLLGTRFRLVTGYPGSREMMLAIEQGEVQGQCGISWNSVAAAEPDWIPSGKVRVLAQEATKPLPEASGVTAPLTLDFAKTDEQRQVLATLYSQEIFGRPYVMPEEVPAGRVQALRQAFIETMHDPALTADAKRLRLEINPIGGAEVQALVARLYATPPAIVERLKRGIVYTP